MYSRAHIPALKRWLPLLVMLVVLAQLASAGHWHEDNRSVVDCSLCLHHSGSHALHTGHSIPSLPAMAAVAPAPITVSVSPSTPCLPVSIRGPPTLSLS
ncbi:hypothetical protein GCM10027217_42180 [Pseudomaricurvus hydrocarbonicus]